MAQNQPFVNSKNADRSWEQECDVFFAQLDTNPEAARAALSRLLEPMIRYTFSREKRDRKAMIAGMTLREEAYGPEQQLDPETLSGYVSIAYPYVIPRLSEKLALHKLEVTANPHRNHRTYPILSFSGVRTWLNRALESVASDAGDPGADDDQSGFVAKDSSKKREPSRRHKDRRSRRILKEVLIEAKLTRLQLKLLVAHKLKEQSLPSLALAWGVSLNTLKERQKATMKKLRAAAKKINGAAAKP